MGQYEFFGSVRLIDKTISAVIISPVGVMKISSTPMDATGMIRFGNTFDSNTKIMICGDTYGSLVSGCFIQSVAIWYTDVFTDANIYLYGIYRN